MDLQDIFGVSTPDYLPSLLGQDKANEVSSSAGTAGLLNGIMTYLATPKNQQYGSPIPYIAQAWMAGNKGAQGTYDQAIEDKQTQMKIDDAKRVAKARADAQALTDQLSRDPRIANSPELQLLLKTKPDEVIKMLHPEAKIIDGQLVQQSYDAEGKPTVNVLYGDKALKAPPERTIYKGDNIIQQQLVEAPSKDNPEGVWKEVGTGNRWKQVNATPPDPSEVDFYAKQRIAGNRDWMSGLARDADGRALMLAVNKRIPSMVTELGLNPEDYSTVGDIKKSLSVTLNDRTKFLGTATQFVNNFQKEADIVDKTLNAGAINGVPVIDRWIQAGRRSIAGDPAVTAFDVAVRGLAREHQRIVTGVTSNAQLHASAQDTADQLLNINMTPAQIRASVKIMREEAKNALDAGTAEVNDIQNQMKNLNRGNRGAVGTSPNTNASQKTVVRTGTDATGKKVIQYSDGTLSYAN